MAALLSVSVLGCGSSTEDLTVGNEPEPTSPPVEEQPGVELRSFNDVFTASTRDYVTYPSVEALQKDASAIVDGTFGALESGPVITESIGGEKFVTNTAVAQIKVDRLLYGEEVEQIDFFFMLPPNTTLEEVAAVYPEGQRVVIAGSDYVLEDGPGTDVSEMAEGTALMTALPQGFLFEERDGTLAAPWGGYRAKTPVAFDSLDSASSVLAG
jgi:hypothetical protein